MCVLLALFCVLLLYILLWKICRFCFIHKTDLTMNKKKNIQKIIWVGIFVCIMLMFCRTLAIRTKKNYVSICMVCRKVVRRDMVWIFFLFKNFIDSYIHVCLLACCCSYIAMFWCVSECLLKVIAWQIDFLFTK